MRHKKTRQKIRSSLLRTGAVGMITTQLTALSIPSVAFAGESWICNGTEEQAAAEATDGAGTAQQKLQYCKAYKSAQKSADTNEQLMKVWAGVTGVCTVACAMSLTGYGKVAADMACTGSSVAGSVVDYMKTKELMGLLMGLGGAAYSVYNNYSKWMESTGMSGGGSAAAANPLAGSAAKASNGMLAGPESQMTAAKAADSGGFLSAKSDSKASCVSAAMSAYTTFNKHQGAQDAKKTAEKNLAQAAALRDAKSAAPTVASGSAATAATTQKTLGYTGPSTVTTNGTGSDTTGNISGTGENSASESSSDPCAAGAAGNPQATIACAVAADKNLPAFVQDPKFADEIQRNTGLNLADFFKGVKENGPTAGMVAGANPLGAEAKKMLTEAYAQMQAQPSEEGMYAGGAGYTGGGGGAQGGGGSGQPDLAGLLNGVLGKFDPNAKKGEEKPATGNMAFNEAQRKLASASAEDKSMSIFERVGYRYLLMTPRILNPAPQAPAQPIQASTSIR